MKGTRNFMDLGNVFDEIFEATRNFQDGFQIKFNPFDPNGPRFNGKNPGDYCNEPFNIIKNIFDENTDFYPHYTYPPMNIYITEDRALIFEFALAGFDEKDISLSFQGDYMVFSAKINADNDSENPVKEENISYFKRRLKLKDIEKQKYFVPLDKYAQEKVKAVYKNGILRIFIPPKDEPDQSDGIRIEIVKEGN